jgi:hypothetical protein
MYKVKLLILNYIIRINSINVGNVNTVIELFDLTKIKSNLNGGILPSFMIRDIVQSAYKDSHLCSYHRSKYAKVKFALLLLKTSIILSLKKHR